MNKNDNFLFRFYKTILGTGNDSHPGVRSMRLERLENWNRFQTMVEL